MEFQGAFPLMYNDIKQFMSLYIVYILCACMCKNSQMKLNCCKSRSLYVEQTKSFVGLRTGMDSEFMFEYKQGKHWKSSAEISRGAILSSLKEDWDKNVLARCQSLI